MSRELFVLVVVIQPEYKGGDLSLPSLVRDGIVADVHESAKLEDVWRQVFAIAFFSRFAMIDRSPRTP